ncbi:MAG: hypothetical protein KAH23_01670 [Kiritimatiellae bacterium]|nr:hypothetical protein [Kiritimatiellia bacterium]
MGELQELSAKQQAESYINERIEEANLHADNALELFDAFMTALSTSTSGITELGQIDGTLEDIGEYSPSYDLPIAPVSPDFNEPTVPSITLTPFVPVEPFGDIEIPELPDDVDTPPTMIPFYEADYISSVLDELRVSIMTGLAGGTGLDPEVEQAIYDRDLNRRDVEATNAYNETLNLWSNRGFEMPTGALSSALQQILNERVRNLGDQSRDIMIQAATLEQENLKSSRDQALQLENMLAGLFDKQQDRLFDKEKTQIQNAIDMWKMTWERYQNMMAAVKIEADINIAKIKASTDMNSNIADMNIAIITQAKTEMELELGLIDSQTRVFSAEVAAFEAKVKEYQTIEGVKMSSYETQVKHVVAQAELAVKAADANIQALISVRAIILESAKTGSNVSAQILASALNSVNAGVSYGYSGAYSSNHGHSYNETKEKPSGLTSSYSENHTYDHSA